MINSGIKTPVLFLVFCREDLVIKSFNSIRNYQPNQLFIAADGPRASKAEEKILCDQTRKTVLDMIDWPCEVSTLFRDDNLGCAKAVSGAIDWFFNHVDHGIIVEDDCALHPDFFYLCDELLPLYKNNEQVMQICAHNPAGSGIISNEYVFAHNAFIWGWATWKRAWDKMDMQMRQWPRTTFISLVKEYGFIQACFRQYYWQKTYSNLNSSQSWATRWNFSVFSNEGLCISPLANMSLNTGIGNAGGTHYDATSEDPYKYLKYGSITFPLNHPKYVAFDENKIKKEQKDFKRLRLIGLKNKLKQIKINCN